jgi:5-oxoprolinase (ATP-hydrolysing)
MARTAAEAGFDRVIGFDMGGTSTDVSLFAGRYERGNETRIAGARIRAPMMRIHTVAAGGGSICRFDGARFLVGPESAGAVPGPACYRRGGPLTVTDCNVMLGKIQPDVFPHLFGPDGNQPIDAQVVIDRFAELSEHVAVSPRQIAEGFVAVAVANMANAIKAISVAKGHDLARFTLACFGGAGGQHACLVADALGMDWVMIHPLAGVLSAYGMGLAERSVVRERTLAIELIPANVSALRDMIAALESEARAVLVAQDIGDVPVRSEVQMLLRYVGTDSTIEVAAGEPEAMRTAFEVAYRQRFGFLSDAAVVVEMVRVEVIAEGGAPLHQPLAGPPPRAGEE